MTTMTIEMNKNRVYYGEQSFTLDTLINEIAHRTACVLAKQDEKEFISKNQAEKRYGTTKVRNWIKSGKLHYIKGKRRCDIQVADCEYLLGQELQSTGIKFL